MSHRQNEEIIALLGEIRDLLKAQQQPPPLPAVPYEQVAAMMDAPPYDPLAGLRTAAQEQQAARGDGPTMGAAFSMTDATIADAFSALHDQAMQAIPPVQTWTPAPGKTGPAWCYPNPALTPGAANPQITQANIGSTLAVSGWTATVRPPVATTRVIKQHIMERDGLTGDPAQWELDHWYPIECAGAVCDIANFWCMSYLPYPGAREKDHVENWLKSQIVSGAMTIEQAHKIINDDWYACFVSIRKMGLLPMMVSYDPDGSSDPDDNA